MDISARALRALSAGLAVLLAAAWITRLPGLGDFTLGLLSNRFGAMTWAAAAGTLIGVFLLPGRGTWSGWGGALGATAILVMRFGFDAEITRRRSALLALACVTIPWLLHAILHASLSERRGQRDQRSVLWLSVAVVSAAGLFQLRALDLLPYRTKLAPIEAALAPTGAPDIVLITLDTTRFDAVMAAAPTLTAFAARAITFPRASAESPFTHPSMASLLTSRTPLEHDSFSTSPAIDPTLPTLATHLRQHGYRTAGFLDNPWLGPAFGISEGYEYLDRRTDLRRIESWLNQPVDARPVLLHVHLFEPHGPYELRPELLDRLQRPINMASRETLGDSISADYIRAGEIPGAHGLSDADFQWLETVYLTEVAAMDAWLASFLDMLAKREAAGRPTLIAITADHGEEFGDHGALHHSHTLYEELIHVPLMLHIPGLAPATHSTAARLVDVAPTLLQAAKLAPLPQAVGTDLLQDLAVEPAADRVQVSTRFHARGAHLLSIKSGEWKLHVRVPDSLDLQKLAVDFKDEALPGSLELYRLDTDPTESDNVATQEPAKVDELLEALKSWHASVLHRLQLHRERNGLTDEGSPERRPSRQTLEQLRQLGYSTEVK
ncbi:MAG: arylsulfatase A-like enzyme [Planctomycetota bacterium]|jgi:arylsulfatase A-like enzyme